jgi:hypothetical protein
MEAEEFHWLSNEIKSAWLLKDRKDLVPSYHYCADIDDESESVKSLSRDGGSQSGWGETPVSVQIVIEYLFRGVFCIL